MSDAEQMVPLHPRKAAAGEPLTDCITACLDCEHACTACADACLGERDATTLVRCIRLDLDCADICMTTARVMSRQTAFDPTLARALLQACARACHICGDECDQHAQHGLQHCQVCREACQRCEQACNTLSRVILHT